MSTALRTASFHPLPVIGHPPAFYERQIQAAEKAGDVHARASHKVGQYVTEGLDHSLPWSKRLASFCHALKHYGHPPADADEGLTAFYQKLSDLIHKQAGNEAVREARKFHESAIIRLRTGTPRDGLEDEAEQFFTDLMSHERCPNWCNKDAAAQIAAIRDYWI